MGTGGRGNRIRLVVTELVCIGSVIYFRLFHCFAEFIEERKKEKFLIARLVRNLEEIVHPAGPNNNKKKLVAMGNCTGCQCQNLDQQNVDVNCAKEMNPECEQIQKPCLKQATISQYGNAQLNAYLNSSDEDDVLVLYDNEPSKHNQSTSNQNVSRF